MISKPSNYVVSNAYKLNHKIWQVSTTGQLPEDLFQSFSAWLQTLLAAEIII